MALPPSGGFITPQIDQEFIDTVKQLISDFRETITAHKKPTIQDCPNCLWDAVHQKSANRYDSSNPNPAGPLNKLFPQGGICPVCNGEGKLNTPQSTEVIGAVIRKSQELDTIEINRGLMARSLIVTYTEAEFTDLFSVTTNITVAGFKYERFAEPEKIGLSTKAFVKILWKRI